MCTAAFRIRPALSAPPSSLPLPCPTASEYSFHSPPFPSPRRYQLRLQNSHMDASPADESARLEAQLGLCRCLRLLGLVSQMKDCAEGAARQWHRHAERLQLRACASSAAWRLG